MARTDDFKISPDDGYRYAAPERDRDRQDREAGYVILVLIVALVMLATALGWVTLY
ncbi:MAG: hypothetical protein JWP74_1873 [Marmoricola sp.]|nr:hypothetical protein [Marmoricola sp.]